MVYAEGSDSDFTTTHTLYITYDTTREGKRIQRLGGVDPDAPTTRILHFSSTAHIEEDNYLQTHLGNFLSIKGMNWVWQRIDPTDYKQPELADVGSTFDLPGLVRTENDLPLKMAFYCDSPPEFIPNIKASVVINENWEKEFVIHTFDEATFFVTVPADILREKNNILNVTAEVPESTPKRPSSLYFDYMEITYPRDFAVVNGRLEFSTDEIEWSHREPAELRIKSSDVSDLYGYFISDLYTVYTLDLRYDVKKQSYICTLPSDAHGRVISTDIDVVPSLPDPVAVKPNTLRNERAGADYLIVSYREFIPLLAPLVDLREDNGLEVKVVDVESIYDEFNHGVESPEALKAFFSYALCNWRKPPGYVLLVGDATSDYLNVARNDIINQVPSYTQESENKDDRWASDFWYTTVCGSDLFPDMVVGRLSVCNREDARVVIEKIVEYERHPVFGPWRQTTGYIADDGPFDDDCEEIRTQSTPQSFVGKTIYLEEFPWEDNFYLPKSLVEQEKLKISTRATTTLRDLFNNGMVYVTFFGHGSPNIWTDEKIWFGMASKNADSLLLNNREKLTFISNFTCNTGAFDYPIFPWSINISEDMMRVEHGGAIGFFVPSGPGYSYVHRPMAHALHKALFVEASSTC